MIVDECDVHICKLFEIDYVYRFTYNEYYVLYTDDLLAKHCLQIPGQAKLLRNVSMCVVQASVVARHPFYGWIYNRSL